jgi:quercetin dioxygenase-like cupin family protein
MMKRSVVNYKNADFKMYGLQGTLQEDISWHNISWSDEDASGFFLAKFEPGGVSIPHEHLGYEEFVILEGELVDHDGWVYHTGDCVSLKAGSRHYTKSDTGAIVAVFVRGGFKTLEDGVL